jgi:hypothetical protein
MLSYKLTNYALVFHLSFSAARLSRYTSALFSAPNRIVDAKVVFHRQECENA